MPQFETRITLPQTRETVFDFLIRTANLVQLIPPNGPMQIISVPEILEQGSRLEFKASAYGQTMKIVHQITGLIAPTSVTEEQVEGLFKRWVHQHVVEEGAEGTVVAIDRIEFEPPGGMLGFVVTKRKILEQLESLFAHRHRQMQKILGGTPA